MLHDFLTAHTVHLGNTGPPRSIDLPNTDTIHYTIIQYHYKSYQESKQWEALQLMTADMFSKILLCFKTQF